jgi:hypothetical protein
MSQPEYIASIGYVVGGYTTNQMQSLQKVYSNQKKNNDHLTWHETQSIFHKTTEGKKELSDNYVYKGKRSKEEIRILFNKYLSIITSPVRKIEGLTNEELLKEISNLLIKLEIVPREKRSKLQNNFYDEYGNILLDDKMNQSSGIDFYKTYKDQLNDKLDDLVHEFEEIKLMYIYAQKLYNKLDELGRHKKKPHREYLKFMDENYLFRDLYDHQNFKKIMNIIQYYRQAVLTHGHFKMYTYNHITRENEFTTIEDKKNGLQAENDIFIKDPSHPTINIKDNQNVNEPYDDKIDEKLMKKFIVLFYKLSQKCNNKEPLNIYQKQFFKYLRDMRDNPYTSRGSLKMYWNKYKNNILNEL